MISVAKRHQDKLSLIQERIRDYHEYFHDNVDDWEDVKNGD